MSVIKINPTNQEPHTRLLNGDISGLSNNALVVYVRLIEIHPDCNPTDKYMSKKCNMSLVTYKKAKKELINKGLLNVQRMGGKGANIIYHVGSKAVDEILIKKGKKTF